MNPLEYPDIHFKLEGGRVVNVDSFVWEEHAEDVSEESNRVWKEVFLDRTLH